MDNLVDFSARLAQLAKLRSDGLLTDQEFQNAKDRLFDNPRSNASNMNASGIALPLAVTHGVAPKSSSWKLVTGCLGAAVVAAGLVVLLGISKSESADCKSAVVHEVLFSLLRQNFPAVLQHSDNVYLAGLGQVGGLVTALAIINPDKSGKSISEADRRAMTLFRNPGEDAQFRFNYLSDEENGVNEKTRSCSGNVHLSLRVPEDLKDTFKATDANVEVAFQVSDDVSQPGRFIVRLRRLGD